MDIQYLTLSFSHKSTPISVREKLAIESQNLESFLLQLKQKITAIDELMFISTCNRVEFYITTHAPQECIAGILDHLCIIQNLELSQIEKYYQIALGQEAVHYVFNVASSLDSVVIGETQITGQIKNAYKMCFDLGICGQNITRLIHFAFRCAAQVRNQTQISQSPLSVASVAVKKALTCNAKNKNALVIGLGEIGKLTSRHLLDSGFSITLVNRNPQKALHFVEELKLSKKDISKITIADFTKLAEILNDFDFIFKSTSSNLPIITQDMVCAMPFERFWFDLAVPRDIQESIHTQNLMIFCVDDLKSKIEENLTQKKIQAHLAYALIGQATQDFFVWLQNLNVQPIIKTMRQNAKNACLQELNRAIKKGYLPKEWEEEVKIILHNAFNVFLHNPTLNLKNITNKQEGDSIIEAIKVIFGEEQEEEAKFLDYYKCEYKTPLKS